MPRTLNQAEAELLLVAHFLNPMNGYTWQDADATKATQDDYREAVTSELADNAADPLLGEAIKRADFKVVMRALVAVGRVFYPRS